jgi:hypothetical protein
VPEWNTTIPSSRPASSRPAIGLLAASGCLGGQSGGLVDDGEPPIGGSQLAYCECVLGGRAVATTGTLTSVDACGARVIVEQVLAGGERAPVAVGDALEGVPAGCSLLGSLQAGDDVLALYAPAAPAPPASTGAVESPAELFLAPLGVALRIEQTQQDLPEPLEQALAILLDADACVQWAMDHAPQSAAGDQEQGEAADDLKPDAMIIAVDPEGAPADTEPIDEQPEVPDCGP